MRDISGKVLSILDDDYLNWIQELKKRYKQFQSDILPPLKEVGASYSMTLMSQA